MKVKTQKANNSFADVAMVDKSVRIDNETKLITGSKAYLLIASCYVYLQ